jgi:hypothetical protein
MGFFVNPVLFLSTIWLIKKERKERMVNKEKDDNIIKLRLKIKEAISLGLASDDSIFEGTLINLYNQCRAGEERCKVIAAEHEKKVSQARAQASAYSQMTSIVYGTISGFIEGAKKDVFELEPQDDDLTPEEIAEEAEFRRQRLEKERTLKKAAEERSASINKLASSKKVDKALEAKSVRSSTKKASNQKASKKSTTRRRR